MCESRVFLEKGGSRELLMEDVVRVVVESGGIRMMGILGEKREIKGRIKEINLNKHEIIIE